MKIIDSESSFGQTPTLPPAPTTHASWFAVAAIGVGSFALVTAEFLPVGLLPQIAADIGITEGQTGLMVACPGAAAAVAAPLSLAVAGHLDRRKLLCLTLAAVCLSNLLVVIATGFATILCARLLLGAALGSFWTIAGALGSRLRAGVQGTRATAIILSGISLGTIAGVPAGALLSAHLGWRAPFLLTAALAGLVVVALLALLPPIVPARSAALKAIPVLLGRTQTLLAVVATLLLFGGQCSAYTFVTPYLEQRIHLNAELLSAVLLGYGLAGVVGNLFGGWLAARGERSAVISTALLLTLALTPLVLFDLNVWFACVCILVWGLASGMMPIILQTYVLNSAPNQQESASAVLVTTIQVAIGVGSLVGGLATDRLGVVAALGIGAAAAALTAGILLLRSSPWLARAPR